jgi:uncharacterized protein (TIGR01777 family)
VGATVRVGVTGSSGFIGSALVAALEERGDEVVRFVRPESPAPPGSVIRWDPSRQLIDDADLARVGGFDAVINLAGAGIGDRRWTAARKHEIERSRLGATELLVSTLRTLPSGTPMLASGSAIGVYGSRGDEVLDETSTLGHDFLAQLCSRWEEAANALREHGAVVATLRTGIVMSAQGGTLKRQLPLFRLGLGGPHSSGAHWLSPISLQDQVRAILWVIDRQLSGPINVVCPTPLTNEQFTRDLANALHRPAFARIPAVILKVVLGAQLTTEAVLASQRVAPMKLTENGFNFENPDGPSIAAQVVRLLTI